MKKLILLLFGLSLIGCVKESPSFTQSKNVDSMLPMESQYVNVSQGKITIVTDGADTLLVTTKSGKYLLPKKVGGILTYNEIDSASHNYIKDKMNVFQTVAFEDCSYSDYDYNDLIIHTKLSINAANKTVKIEINPIAFGAVKHIALGVTINGKPHCLISNCRKELFNNDAGMINTRDVYKKYPIITKELTGVSYKDIYGDLTKVSSIDWWIAVDQPEDLDEVDSWVKLYAISKNFNCWDKNNKPYGLILCNIRNNIYTYNKVKCGADWFHYPLETEDITNVYPAFAKFNEGQIPNFSDFATPMGGNYYDIDKYYLEDPEKVLYCVIFK